MKHIPGPILTPHQPKPVPVMELCVFAHSASFVQAVPEPRASVPFILMIIGSVPFAVASSVYIPILLVAVSTIIINAPGIREASCRNADQLVWYTRHQPL